MDRSDTRGGGLSLKAVVAFSLAAFAVLTVATALLQPTIVERFHPLPVDQGPAWYYWQLAETSVAARLSYWIGYAVHQIVVIVLLLAYRKERPASGMASRANVTVLGVNILFVALHLVQTRLWYDGLAQDVPIWSSQGSVIVMLVLILFMEMPHRGLFWGRWRKVPVATYRFVRDWHGLYISWAVIYTFWFHPMDGNWGLLSGFIYLFLLFMQLSLFNTSFHNNRSWVVLLEAFVVIHATLITVYKANPIWPMFMVGFLVMYIVTQQHALEQPKWLTVAVTVLFVVAVGLLYVLVRGTEHLYEITFIPVALYGGTVGLWLLGWLIERLMPKSIQRSGLSSNVGELG